MLWMFDVSFCGHVMEEERAGLGLCWWLYLGHFLLVWELWFWTSPTSAWHL